MKANIFLKENGLKKCSRIVEDLIEQGNDGEFVKNLKRLVDSHELVECYGGYDLAKNVMQITPLRKSSYDLIENLKQAIADVESCK